VWHGKKRRPGGILDSGGIKWIGANTGIAIIEGNARN
jgi:hypothetical protein